MLANGFVNFCIFQTSLNVTEIDSHGQHFKCFVFVYQSFQTWPDLIGEDSNHLSAFWQYKHSGFYHHGVYRATRRYRPAKKRAFNAGCACSMPFFVFSSNLCYVY